MKKIEILALQTVPEIKIGDNLAEIIVRCSDEQIGGLREKDIVVVTSKIVSKDKQLSHRVCENEQAVCVTMGKDGIIHTCDAGIDASNHPPGFVGLLPEDIDAEAKKIREKIQNLIGKKLAVVIADTEIVPFGTMDLAIGSCGIGPISKMFGTKDLFGKPKFGGIDLTAYELAAASALVFGQTAEAVAVAVIRGFEYEINETENISNTLTLHAKTADIADAAKAILRATSFTKGLKTRVLLRIAAWFV